MTKTENFALNQWDAADPIRREDFNSDNAKLDAALAAIWQAAESKAEQSALEKIKSEMPVVLLGSYATEDGNVSAHFDLSALDMSRFSQLSLWVGGVADATGTLCLRFNGDTSANYASSGGTNLTQITLATPNSSAVPAAVVAKIPGGITRVHVTADVYTYQTMTMLPGYSSGHSVYNGCGLAGLTSIHVYSTSALNAGIEVALYGFRK